MSGVTSERVGISVGYGKEESVTEIAATIGLAEKAGFDMAMFSETVFIMRDSVSALATAAAQTSSIGLGAVQVARLRSPLLMAQTLATLDEASGGRVVVALGACTSLHEAVHGLDHADPVSTLTEWVTALRLLLTGTAASFEGQFVSFEHSGLGWQPVRESIPILVAATSATGLRLAGRIGDGVLLNAIASTAYTRNALAIVHEEALKAGRDPDDLMVAQIINVSVDDDENAAFDAVRWEVASKFTPRAYQASIPPRLRVGEPLIDPADVPGLHSAFGADGFGGLAAAIPTEYLRGLTASGNPDVVRNRVAAYRQAGVDLPILRPAQPGQTSRILEMFNRTPESPKQPLPLASQA